MLTSEHHVGPSTYIWNIAPIPFEYLDLHARENTCKTHDDTCMNYPYPTTPYRTLPASPHPTSQAIYTAGRPCILRGRELPDLETLLYQMGLIGSNSARRAFYTEHLINMDGLMYLRGLFAPGHEHCCLIFPCSATRSMRAVSRESKPPVPISFVRIRAGQYYIAWASENP